MLYLTKERYTCAIRRMGRNSRKVLTSILWILFASIESSRSDYWQQSLQNMVIPGSRLPYGKHCFIEIWKKLRYPFYPLIGGQR